MAGRHVHVLVSHPNHPETTYDEIVPDTYHKGLVTGYYKERGFDVLIIPDAEICGVKKDKP